MKLPCHVTLHFFLYIMELPRSCPGVPPLSPLLPSAQFNPVCVDKEPWMEVALSSGLKTVLSSPFSFGIINFVVLYRGNQLSGDPCNSPSLSVWVTLFFLSFPALFFFFIESFFLPNLFYFALFFPFSLSLPVSPFSSLIPPFSPPHPHILQFLQLGLVGELLALWWIWTRKKASVF